MRGVAERVYEGLAIMRGDERNFWVVGWLVVGVAAMVGWHYVGEFLVDGFYSCVYLRSRTFGF